MWRPSFTILQKVVLPSFRDNLNLSKFLFSTKSRLPKSTSKLTLVSASIGVLVGAGYGGYTHYKVNVKKTFKPGETEEYAFLKEAPEYAAHYKIINDADTSNLQLTLFQYRTCPFCCKVRAYLDARGISYEIVEVDAVLRQAIKWSGYKKVPILLAKVDGGYQQLLDSTAIISVLETCLKDKSSELREIIKFYPVTKFVNETGNESTDIANKYFIMHQANVPDEKEKALEVEERQWRQWADRVLVNTLSPNVYRTAGEALETFQWFEQAGGWRQFFPAWECTLMVYIGAAAMYMISKRLKTRHKIKDDPRESLYDAVNEWMGAVQSKGTPFLGGDKPNLADVTVFGVLSSIEGCTAFQDLKNNTAVEKWYYETKNAIERRMGKVIAVHA
ncbi:prostaglandin E synthase 2 [Spodoptera litura]|uniref:Prostaglandin E synthase 2 n=1 Tax=Spodoptera litura TaxID=69820 RepID=A0A9J7EQF9_SPOLT|nr:prostaglandin E synthase 2 [Spodoptera litura]